MKIGFAIYATMIIIAFSCKKSNDHINTPPVVTDSTKPPVVNVDTSTLLKSDQEYSYSGGVIVDSELSQWKYDDQRRITQKTYAFVNSNDTTRYTYLNDRYIETFNGYTNGSLRNISNSVYYLGLNNRVDSIFISSTGYGMEAGTNTNYVTYYYYNQENQDSLEMHFTGRQGARSLYYTVNYFYSGANLDSAIILEVFEGEGGTLNYSKYVDYFSKGNLISQTEYDNNVFSYVNNYNYTSIPTGLLDITNTQYAGILSYRNTNLISGFSTISFTYEQDAANRVTGMTWSVDGVAEQKHVFTYY
jgi:hypothetical protein